ncbi:plasmid maintenance system killer [Acidithiobacillus thiooxidans]|uniref:type II toxin-antitoxin system RelE/ParE family toxin n=1 Tax=Acidithiobacillus thiooxidans TaxID=930 RepID=UPI001C0727F6|nr:type II toxin-antitoxin system RelE/ParE family toxin [Acidithiobacillus thiooxidans]MBU2749785.1 plasmid maintenance system killer [Acidithiobacillus thiooxidans]
MIRSFVHKGLKQVFETGQSAKIGTDLVTRCKRRLDAINAAASPEELNVPGFDFHALEGKPKRYTVHVNGPYCITFEWREGDAWRVDLENYH